MLVGDLETAIAESRTAAGDNYVNVLGASVAAQCLDPGVLDEVLVSVLPVLLDDATRLFEYPAAKPSDGQRSASRTRLR
jgi:dihydrofolate reductase